MKIRIHRILEDTKAEGPGRRFCIWVQGCSLRCPGCFAPDTWDPDGGYETDTKDILELLEKCLRKEPKPEGITILGGEPFLQAAPLAQIASFARDQGLSVICFSGYTLAELLMRDGAEKKLLAQIDLLVDGPFIEGKRDFSRPWAGSSNQRFHFLTDRYSPGQIMALHNKLEIRLHPDGSVTVNGMADYRNVESEEKHVY